MRRDLRLLPVAGGAWTVALLCVHIPGAAGWCAAGCGLGAVAVSGMLLRRADRRATRLGLFLVVLAAGAAVSFSIALAWPARDIVASHDGRVVELTAEITSSASTGQDGRLWIEAQIMRIGPPGAPAAAVPVSAPVRIGVDPQDGFDLGARVVVVGEAEATDAGERTALVVFVGEAVIERPASEVFALAAETRRAFVERSLRLPEPGAGLLPGLAVGDTRAVGEDLDDDMRTSGLSHLTAVSGANCAIVVGAAFWLTALCGGGREVRVIAAATALAAFVLLVTPEPSVIRAAVMAGVAMLSILLGRPSAGAGMLALSATGILIADPWLASTPGFALSVAASGALILLAPSLARGLERWMPKTLALAIAVPTAAQLVCGPIIALFAEQQSLIGLAANLLAAPAAPIVTIIGLLGCLAAPVPPLADLLAASAWLPASWIATTASVSADLPFAQIALTPGVGSAMLVALVSASVGVVLVDGPRTHGPRTDGPRTLRAVRAVATSVLAVALALGGAQIVLNGPLAAATSPSAWSIAACDIGQGDAILLKSDGEVALIDTGPEPGPLDDCLRSLGIDRIDVLVLTHFDLDHVGGAAAVTGRVDRVLHGRAVSVEDERVLNALEQGGAELVDAAAGLEGELGTASWRVLWPPRSSPAFPDGNDASIVIEVAGGGVPRSLYLGDLSAEAQRALARAARLSGAYAVVKVAHHGSADQDAGLYETLRPTVALISAGVDNDYGHPRDEILAILQGVDAHVLRTDQQGRILLGVRDGELEVWTDE
ncbi:ComEC/Rec2 family competence protein [Microbacterium sp. 3J1]|uniref:ComEC/Rec2 family competence protein n=1 Tax=Microbacterium sp. 3J1 TaxID=861269 RepID=UPI000A5544F4|nr:ComEC/Rec2 family competence protein [Microbacterium sp. 3J1]